LYIFTTKVNSSPLAPALFTYDTLLTLSHEVDYIWFKKLKLGTALYILARCSTLLVLSLEVLEQFLSTSLQVCFGQFFSFRMQLTKMTLVIVVSPGAFADPFDPFDLMVKQDV
jgi:Family of unknown function (DUF6533)